MSAGTKVKVAWVGVALCAGLWTEASLAQEQGGAVTSPARLSVKARAQLGADIAAAKASHPEIFATLQRIRAELPDLDANKRGRLAPLTPALKAMGVQAVPALLNEIAVDAAPRGELTDDAWLAWRLGLVEATGMLRDVRAEPVLAALVDGPNGEFLLMKAAAEALGRMGTDTAAAKLIGLARTEGPKQLAVLAGMGECRRARVAGALAQTLSARPEPKVAFHVVKSLQNVGSDWAWQTPVISKSGEEAQVRGAAAKALVAAFVAYDGEVREAALKALLVVNHDGTPALIAQAKTDASPSLKAELERLAQRFDNGPLRRGR